MSITLDIKGDLRNQVEAMSGGEMTVRYTAKGQPSYFYRFRRDVFEADVEPELSVNHPAFFVNGVQKSEILVGIHQAAEVNGEAVSQAGLMPRVSINHDQAVDLCRVTGPGFFACTNPIYAAIALQCRARFRYPRGNNNYGKAYNAPNEYGVDENGDPGTGSRKTAIRAGSGPATWNHPPTPFGIQNLNGNVWEWSPGMRIVDGEIQIIEGNDAALIATDLSDSGPWQAVDATTGNLVAPGTAGAVKYASSGSADGTLALSNGRPFSDMQANEVSPAALTLLKRYGLMPPGAPMESDYFYLSTSGERLPFRGGSWSYAAGAGVFALNLSHPRSISYATIGFRPAFVL